MTTEQSQLHATTQAAIDIATVRYEAVHDDIHRFRLLLTDDAYQVSLSANREEVHLRLR